MAGGTNDMVARLMGVELGKALGQTVVVENRPGASGAIGMQLASRSPADGYTLAIASDTASILSATRKMDWRLDHDMAGVAMVGDQPIGVAVSMRAPYASLDELLAAARKEPGTIAFGTSGLGTSQHIVGEWLTHLAGVQISTCPKGGGQAVTDLVSGTTPAAVLDFAPLLGQSAQRRDTHRCRHHGRTQPRHAGGADADRIGLPADHALAMGGRGGAARHAAGDRQAPVRRHGRHRRAAGDTGQAARDRPDAQSMDAAQFDAFIHKDVADWGRLVTELEHQAGLIRRYFMSQVTQHPNVVLILADNLGWASWGAMAAAPSAGAHAAYRCAGRAGHAVSQLQRGKRLRAHAFGAHDRAPPGAHRRHAVGAGRPAAGLVPWERTLAQAFSEQGYATAMYGKWHLGDKEGRYPRTAASTSGTGSRAPPTKACSWRRWASTPTWWKCRSVMEGRKGSPAERRERYDLEMRRRIDEVLTQRSCEFIGRHAGKAPFFLYVPLTQLHFPTIPHREFEGRTGKGRFCRLPGGDGRASGRSWMQSTSTASPTIPSSSSPATTDRSTAGPGAAAPACGPAPITRRWKGRCGSCSSCAGLAVPAGRQTNEIVHVVDLFPTLAGIAGPQVPQDRPIDGVDQSAFLLGREEKSAREGFVYYIKNELRAAKWRDWKMHFVWEVE